jgi:hypothetical protein
MKQHELEWCSIKVRACETLVEASEVAVLFRGAWGHANVAEDSTMMAEFGGGKRKLTWTMELHTKVHGNVSGSILELGVGTGDTGMARRLWESAQGVYRGAGDCGEDSEVMLY